MSQDNKTILDEDEPTIRSFKIDQNIMVMINSSESNQEPDHLHSV